MSFQDIYDQLTAWVTYRVPISATGEMGVSIASLVMAVVFLLIFFQASRIAQNLLQKRLLSHVPLDPSVSYTLQRLLHYVIVAIGILVALRIGIGADFTSFAVVITALSVGIGLGLREIAADVAAGFVLLFERPIRVGNRVKLPGELNVEGNVLTIGLRTTKIRTNDRLVVIVPNSHLTNEKCVNWSYRSEPVRVHVPVGVAYGTDLELARRVLLSTAEGVDKVLADPGPSVRLVRFGDSSLDLELLVWTKDPTAHAQIRSDINFRIERGFREAGIEIPFPQRDLNLRGVPPDLLRQAG
jgi:small-conductance mechanosensitive channel